MNSLTIRNYKEPLLAIPKDSGFGYYGTICQTLDSDKLQCHICGKLFRDLATHVRQGHKVSIPDYRDVFQLAETALNSDTLLQEKKARTIAYRQSLGREGRDALEQRRLDGVNKEIERRKRDGFKVRPQSLETQNKRGSCPAQILAKITEVATRMGRTPSLEEFMAETGGQRYRYLITKVYGSWANALKILKLTPKERFSTGRKPKYTDEELLESMRNFAEINHKVPTQSDFKRGYLPDQRCYTKRFGSLEEARQKAGVYKYVTASAIERAYKFVKRLKRDYQLPLGDV